MRLPLLVALSIALAHAPAAAAAVTWQFADSVSACPAGDSVAAGHPANLRIVVTYAPVVGSQPVPRAGVPPESVWVEWTPATGPVRVFDQPGRAYADDSTDAQGRTRLTLRTLSGCGGLPLTLRVSGAAVGSFTAQVRSADTNLDGAVTPADAPCDLDWSGTVDAADAALAAPHDAHLHRQALLGTPVRRTNLCEDCNEYGPGALGESTVSFSPDGRWIAYTVHTDPWADCVVFLVPTDPADGDAPVQFTFPDPGVHDYDPAWSPLGDRIAFGRQDNSIWVKGIPGIAADTSERLVTQHLDGTIFQRGDLSPAFSPDGEWIAFTRKPTAPEHWSLWKTPANGDTSRRVQLTFETDGDDFYPQWSSDGQWLVYDRTSGGVHGVWRVPAAGGTPEPLVLPGGGLLATTPGLSPDAAVVLAGLGPFTAAVTHAVPFGHPAVTLPSTVPVANFPALTLDAADPVMTPRFSPDGTRTALVTNQVWVTRRNTSLPPRVLALGGHAVAPATPVVDLVAVWGVPLEFVVDVADPEGDAITTSAFFLRDGMTFTPATRTFAWTPPQGAVGETYVVRFQLATPSGGAAYALARIAVHGSADAGPSAPGPLRMRPPAPNPFAARCVLRFQLPEAARAEVAVHDVSGRRVRTLADGPLAAGWHERAWDGSDDRGVPAPAGLYLVRIETPAGHAVARLVRLGAR